MSACVVDGMVSAHGCWFVLCAEMEGQMDFGDMIAYGRVDGGSGFLQGRSAAQLDSFMVRRLGR